VVLALLEYQQGHDWTAVIRGREDAPTDRVTHYQAHKGAVQRRDAPNRVREQGLLEVARLEGRSKEILRVTNSRHRMYDLGNDPAETELLGPLESAPTGELEAWLERVLVGLVRSDELPPPVLDDADLDELRALGYID